MVTPTNILLGKTLIHTKVSFPKDVFTVEELLILAKDLGEYTTVNTVGDLKFEGDFLEWLKILLENYDVFRHVTPLNNLIQKLLELKKKKEDERSVLVQFHNLVKPLKLGEHQNFDDLMNRLDELFSFKGELISSNGTYLVTYSDCEGRACVVGGDISFSEFCDRVDYVTICTPNEFLKIKGGGILTPTYNLTDEQVKLQKTLFDFGELGNRLDSAMLLLMVLDDWCTFRQSFVPDFCADGQIPMLFSFIKVTPDLKLIKSKEKIILVLLGYGDPKFADNILHGVLEFWKPFIHRRKATPPCIKDKDNVDPVKFLEK